LIKQLAVPAKSAGLGGTKKPPILHFKQLKMLPNYVFIVPNKDAPDMGAGFILHTKQPFELGRVVKLNPSPFAFTEYKNKFNPLIMAEVPGYSILIAFAGNLFGNKVQVSGKDWEAELQKIYNEMAQFFLDEKVNNNVGYYKRYKNL